MGAAIAANLFEGAGKRRCLPLVLTQRGKKILDALEEQAHLRHLAAQDAMDEAQFLRRRHPIVDELAYLAAKTCTRIRVA